jgi:uncharacterized protein (TIGR03067 family)
MVQRAAVIVCLAFFLLGSRSEVISDERADTGKKAVEKVFKQLEGSWERTSSVRDGKEAALGEKLLFTFKGRTGQLKVGEKVVAEGKFKIDPSKSPTAVDIKPKQGEPMIGIMEIQGDMLTFCWGQGEDRPTKFAAEKGSKQMLEKFKRVRP